VTGWKRGGKAEIVVYRGGLMRSILRGRSGWIESGVLELEALRPTW
jgi:hypothetical protein